MWLLPIGISENHFLSKTTEELSMEGNNRSGALGQAQGLPALEVLEQMRGCSYHTGKTKELNSDLVGGGGHEGLGRLSTYVWRELDQKEASAHPTRS